MYNFAKFTTYDDENIFINMKKIVAISDGDFGSIIFLEGGHNINVKESKEDIVQHFVEFNEIYQKYDELRDRNLVLYQKLLEC